MCERDEFDNPTDKELASPEWWKQYAPDDAQFFTKETKNYFASFFKYEDDVLLYCLYPSNIHNDQKGAKDWKEFTGSESLSDRYERPKQQSVFDRMRRYSY